MSSEVVVVGFRSLLAETKDGEWGKDAYFEDGVQMVVIRGTDFDAARSSSVIGAPIRFIAKKSAERKSLQAYDILIETAGGSKGRPTGKTVLLRPKLFESTSLPITCASFARFLRVDAAIANPEYVYWYLQHLYSNGVIENHQVQHTGIARFQFTKFADSVFVPLPSLTRQAEVAGILASLDDRITLLRETNATLEGIAQALFKSWFVDFDPVRAKMEGRAPDGLDEATAALFPDSLKESETGLVPSGWSIGALGEHTSYLNRGISPKYIENGGVTVINQKCIRDFSIDLSKARRHDTGQRKVDGRELLKGDILVNSTGVGTLGRVAQVLSLDRPAIVDSHVTAIRAGPSLTWNYLGLLIMRKQPEIEGMGEGSTGQTELSRGKLAALTLLIPPYEVLQKFDEIVLPLRDRFSANQVQALSLTALRDTLLPRLISGQLRLPQSVASVAEEVMA